MARMYSVPFTTKTIDVYEVEAKSPVEAAMKATQLLNKNVPPTHSHIHSFDIGSVKATYEDPNDVAAKHAGF